MQKPEKSQAAIVDENEKSSIMFEELIQFLRKFPNLPSAVQNQMKALSSIQNRISFLDRQQQKKEESEQGKEGKTPAKIKSKSSGF